MASPLTHLLDRDSLSHLAGPRSFARGTAYFADGRVRGLAEDEGVVTAKVQGSRSYKVGLWEQKGRLGFSCTCPAAAEGWPSTHTARSVHPGCAWNVYGTTAPSGNAD